MDDSSLIRPEISEYQQEGIANEIEIGCHIWYRDKETFKFLNETFDVDIAPLQKQPKVYRKGKYYKYYMINFFVLLGSPPSFVSIQKNRVFKNIMVMFLRDFFTRGTYNYPRNGSFGFVDNIVSKVKESGVDVLFSTRIGQVDLSKKQLTLENGKAIQFNEQVISTNKSELSSIIDKTGKEHRFEFNINSVNNLYVVIRTEDNPTISYIGVWNDDDIYRVSDVTYLQSELLDLGLRLICVQVFDKFKESDNPNKEEICLLYTSDAADE